MCGLDVWACVVCVECGGVRVGVCTHEWCACRYVCACVHRCVHVRVCVCV